LVGLHGMAAPSAIRTRAVAAVATCLFAAVLIFAQLGGSSFTWLAYLFPYPFVWDGIIHNRDNSGGGVWHYNDFVPHPELTCYVMTHHHNRTSLLDVACNAGYMLSRLQEARPKALHFGIDISARMTALARERCPACNIVQADLSSLQYQQDIGELAVSAVDLVLVSDVLYYIPYARWPPLLLNGRLVPKSFVRTAQRRFFEHLTSLSREEVVFSDHQSNAAVVDFLRLNGATQLPRRGGLWVARGTAPSDEGARGARAEGVASVSRRPPSAILDARYEECVRAERGRIHRRSNKPSGIAASRPATAETRMRFPPTQHKIP